MQPNKIKRGKEYYSLMWKHHNEHLYNVFGKHYKKVFYGTLFLWYGGTAFLKLIGLFLPEIYVNQIAIDMVDVLLLWCAYLFILSLKDRLVDIWFKI